MCPISSSVDESLRTNAVWGAQLQTSQFWSVASATQSEVEHHGSSGATVLPQIRLVILSPALSCLHIDWGFVRLSVTPDDQLSNSPTLNAQQSRSGTRRVFDNRRARA